MKKKNLFSRRLCIFPQSVIRIFTVLFVLAGTVVWSTFLPALSKDSRIQLIEQRSTAHFPLPPQVLLLGEGGGDDSKTLVYTFNPMNGEGLEKPVFSAPYELLQSSILPFEGKV